MHLRATQLELHALKMSFAFCVLIDLACAKKSRFRGSIPLNQLDPDTVVTYVPSEKVPSTSFAIFLINQAVVPTFDCGLIPSRQPGGLVTDQTQRGKVTPP